MLLSRPFSFGRRGGSPQRPLSFKVRVASCSGTVGAALKWRSLSSPRPYAAAARGWMKRWRFKPGDLATAQGDNTMKTLATQLRPGDRAHVFPPTHPPGSANNSFDTFVST